MDWAQYLGVYAVELATSPVVIAAAGLGGAWGVVVGWWAFGGRQRDDRRAYRRRLASAQTFYAPAPTYDWRLSVVQYHVDRDIDRDELLQLLGRRIPLFVLDDVPDDAPPAFRPGVPR